MLIHVFMEAFEYIHNSNRKDMGKFFRLNLEIETREEIMKDNDKDNQCSKNDKGDNDTMRKMRNNFIIMI